MLKYVATRTCANRYEIYEKVTKLCIALRSLRVRVFLPAPENVLYTYAEFSISVFDFIPEQFTTKINITRGNLTFSIYIELM